MYTSDVTNELSNIDEHDLELEDTAFATTITVTATTPTLTDNNNSTVRTETDTTIPVVVAIDDAAAVSSSTSSLIRSTIAVPDIIPTRTCTEEDVNNNDISNNTDVTQYCNSNTTTEQQTEETIVPAAASVAAAGTATMNDDKELDIECNTMHSSSTLSCSLNQRRLTDTSLLNKDTLLLRIPNGEEINAKNTLQSFGDHHHHHHCYPLIQPPAPPPAATVSTIIEHITTNNDDDYNNNTNNTIQVEEQMNEEHEQNDNNGSNNYYSEYYNNGDVNQHLPIVATNVRAIAVASSSSSSYAPLVVNAQPYHSMISVQGVEIHVDQNNNNNDNPITLPVEPEQHDTMNHQQQQEQVPEEETEEVQKVQWQKIVYYKITIITFTIVILCFIVTGISVYFLVIRNLIRDPTPANNTPSISPTNNSTALFKAEIMTTFINSITLLSDRNISIDSVTPEDVALRWMINDDPVFNTTDSWLPIASFFIKTTNDTTATTTSNITNAVQFRFMQRYALLTMWFQQVDSNGTFQPTWTNMNGWTTDPDECNWFGIECSTYNFDEIDGDVGVVTSIEMDMFTFRTGTIPPDLGLLSMINHVSWNGILDRLSFYNGLTGPLPTIIRQWTALTYLDVSGNFLSGALPSTAFSQWTALTYLDVSGYNFNGTLPSPAMEQWTELEYIDIRFNAFTGKLPSTALGQWTALTYFDISNNLFTGTIPTSIGNWVKSYGTISAYFQSNQLIGTMPIGICNFTINPIVLEADCTINCTCCTQECLYY